MVLEQLDALAGEVRRFQSDTRWIFLLACGCAFGLGYATDVWIKNLFPIACVPVIAYMSAVRYDSSGAIRNASDDEAKRR